MTYRNSNYTAFYVDESQLNKYSGLYFAEDYCYYRMIKDWKEENNQFPFIDSHGKTYNVRDESDWETTLKPRLHYRLRMSKNIILVLSNITKQSKALFEEITYGIDTLNLPVIVVYPDLEYVGYGCELSERAIKYWDKLPCFESRIKKIPTAHIPLKKEHLTRALVDPRFSVSTKCEICTVGLNTQYEYELNQYIKHSFRL